MATIQEGSKQKETAAEWETTKIRSGRYGAILKAVDAVKIHGVPKWRSVAAFVDEACKEKLQREGIN